ncbi:MAG: FIST C-terminal domain-containing protein [Candidatus Omnitrophica bacterium]|nr:FIST C-terminal domain-containing protein [Candidatus Omnitrophota bacterium]
MQVGIGLSIASDYLKAAKEAVEKARVNITEGNADLAFVFTTGEFGHPLVLKTISELLNNIPILGASTPALISNQGIFKHGLLIVIFSFTEETYFNTACVKDTSDKNALAMGEELGGKLLYGCKGVHRNLTILFSDITIPSRQNFIFGIQEKVGSSFPLFGAFTSHCPDTKKPLLYFGQQTIINAGCGVLWGGKLNFGLGVKHGWQPLGKPRWVTKSSGSTVNEIDGQPAVNLYKDYLAQDIPELKKEFKHISTLYPLGIKIKGEKEYLLRGLSSIENDGSLIFGADVPQDSTIRLMIASKESCLKATRQSAETTLKSIPAAKIKFALVFNSLARYTLLGRQVNQELNLIKEVLGKDLPLAGIYTCAEEAPLSSLNYLGKTYSHNNSIAILTIAS